MPDFDQLSLFPDSQEERVDLASTLDADSVLEDAFLVFLSYLESEGMSHHTVKAFRSDLNVFLEWVGPDHAVGKIGTADLNHFLDWMEGERGIPCSPKTYARRVTTLKSFFSFLLNRGTLLLDPSAAVIQISARTPTPEILNESELRAVLRSARAHRYHPEKPDARPYLLLTLILEAGIKKAEVMALTLDDIIRENPAAPALWIRTVGLKNVYKERKIAISTELLETIDEYISQREIASLLFECTSRNLEYVLRELAEAAAIEPRRKLSFEALRWTSAFADFRAKMDAEHLREKLGLSKITWRETHSKLLKLAEKMGDA